MPDDPPRLTRRPLPPYAYRPGRNPRPRRPSPGHAGPEAGAARFAPQAWHLCEPWLYALDLFQAGYWWEAHEYLEAFWRAFGDTSPEGQLTRALVQLAASELKREATQRAAGPMTQRAAGRLARRALARLAPLPDLVLGVRVRVLEERVRHLHPAEGTRDAGGPLQIPLDDAPALVYKGD